MKTYFTLFLIMASIIPSTAQDPAIQWQKTIGGNNYDNLFSMGATTDGGYILGGFSYSNISGDKTENSKGGSDIWIVKIDNTGNIEWQKTIGGNDEDVFRSIRQTPDGGYIVAAISISNISGDKTENSRGGADYWILKLNNIGEITWQKTLGGDQDEYQACAISTTDGGYFVSGISETNVSGDKTSPSNGMADFWNLKLDSMGSIVWQNSIGGSLYDGYSVSGSALIPFQTEDDGYIIYGGSESPISGDKTEPNKGIADMWIVKLNPDGSVQWDKTFGGSNVDGPGDMIQTMDGGYLIGGTSQSNISGDKTENSRGEEDYWVLKLDMDRNIIWQKTIGSNSTDRLGKVKELDDGSYMLFGSSYGPISGDKTEDVIGNTDMWMVGLDSFGQIALQNVIGGDRYDDFEDVLSTSDNGFLIGGNSVSNISGDKTDNSKGSMDYWILKVTDNILRTNTNTFPTKVVAYPNPTSGNFSIDLGAIYDKSKVVISNILGQTVTTKNFENAKILNMDLQGVNGIYFATITNDLGNRATFKLIKAN